MRPARKNREKLSVVFDSEARREYLTGFSKRKKERRAQALKEALLKAKEDRANFKAEHRKAAGGPVGSAQAREEDAASARTIAALAGAGTTVQQVSDDFSMQAFGSGMVTVTTTVEEPPAVRHVSLSKPLPKNARMATSDNQKLADRLKQKLNLDGSKRRAGAKNRHFAAAGGAKGKKKAHR
jgi:hypothetical protein